tara:strand:- start:723 stop:1022 length:300 start_codon:yes stop_codon:yes gene_type:complete
MIYPMLEFIKIVETRNWFILEVSTPTNFWKGKGDFAIHNAKGIRANTKLNPPSVCILRLHPFFISFRQAWPCKSKHCRLRITEASLQIYAVKPRKVWAV